MPTPSAQGLHEARELLREYQQRRAKERGSQPLSNAAANLETTLRLLRAQRMFEATDDPNVVRRGASKYDRRTEEQRLVLAEELIRRIDPGPYEDPNYLALLSYQAASVEMALRFLSGELTGERENERWSRLLLGTAPSSEVNAVSTTLETDSYVVVVMHSALVDFVYQSAKAFTAALDPVISSDPRVDVTTRNKIADFPAVLQDNREPIERLYKTLEAYFFRGYPRAFANEPVKPEHGVVLSWLVGLAERFAIAHEYGHWLRTDVDWSHLDVPNPAWAKEFFADQNATIFTVISAAHFDGLSPEFALGGAVFLLACVDVLQRALAVIEYGQDPDPSSGGSHPPCTLRAERVVDVFYHFFEARYEDSRMVDLEFRLRSSDRAPVNETTRIQIRKAFDMGDGLLAIWKPVREMLLRDHADKRPLHPMWRFRIA